MKEITGTGIARTLALLLLLGVGVLLCAKTDLQVSGMALHSPVVGAALIGIAVVGFFGVNVFIGGPLDRRDDSPPVETHGQRAGGVPRRAGRAASEQDPAAREKLRRNWDRFDSELREAVSAAAPRLILGVPEEGMVRVTHEGEVFLSFDRPDDSMKLENYGDSYVRWSLESPDYAFLKAHVVGFDHNRILYVQIELAETGEGEPGYSITFDPDWQKPTRLVFGKDVEEWKWEPYDTVRFEEEY